MKNNHMYESQLANLVSNCKLVLFSIPILQVIIFQVACRIVWILMGLVFMVCGVVGKFGAVLAIVPDPVTAGLSIVGTGRLISVGIAALQHMDFNSPRNQTRLGVSMFLPLCLSGWIKKNPTIIQTGVYTLFI